MQVQVHRYSLSINSYCGHYVCLGLGTLPTVLATLSIQYLYLGENYFSGSNFMESVSTKVISLDLSNTLLSGPILFGNANYSLQEIYLRGCLFEGTIPTNLQSLHEVVKLDFSINSLYGTLPTAFNTVCTVCTVHMYSIDTLLLVLWPLLSLLILLLLHPADY